MTPHPSYYPAPRKKRTGLVITLVVAGVLLLICCVPSSVLGIRYARMETGPHHSLPNVCTALTGDTIKGLVGEREFQREVATAEDAGFPVEGCLWPREHDHETQVGVRSVLYTRSFWGSSTDKARERMEDDRAASQRSVDRFEAEGGSTHAAVAALRGAGHDGFCYGMSGGELIYRYECHVRDGNVVISISVHPPWTGEEREVTQSEVHQAVMEFTDVARDLANDLIEDL